VGRTVTLEEEILVECALVRRTIRRHEGHNSASLVRDVLGDLVREAEDAIKSDDVARMQKALESLRKAPK
jgi:hypothetical protein